MAPMSLETKGTSSCFGLRGLPSFFGIIFVLFLQHPTLSVAAPPLYLTNNQGAYPTENNFRYIIDIYPSLYDLNRRVSLPQGTYFRAKISVQGNWKSKFELLNLSKNEAGIMLIRAKKKIGGKENYCNSTAASDILQQSTDLNSADGVTGPDSMSVEGFATFIVPNEPFKLCYRISVSRYMNKTLQTWNITRFRRGLVPKSWIQTLYKGRNPWEPLDFQAKFNWQLPYRAPRIKPNLTQVLFSTPNGVYAGEWGSLMLHRNTTYPYVFTSINDYGKGDIIKLVPYGSPCITDDSWTTYGGTYQTTNGEYTTTGKTVSKKNAVYGTMSTFGTTTQNYNNGVDSTVSGVNTLKPVAYFQWPAAGVYEVCFSGYDERRVLSYMGNTAGSQSPGWRKLYWVDAPFSGNLTIKTRPVAEKVTWSTLDENAGGWGWIKVTSNRINTLPATKYEGVGSYLESGPGDILKLVPSQYTQTPTSEYANIGCWSRHIENVNNHVGSAGPTLSLDLGGDPSVSTKPWNVDSYSTTSGWAYLRIPFGGSYSVCYRRAFQSWMVLSWDTSVAPTNHIDKLQPRTYKLNTTWSLSDMRSLTWAPLTITAATKRFNTMPHDRLNPGANTTAIRFVKYTDSCLTGTSPYRGETFDVGVAEVGRGVTPGTGRLDDSATLVNTIVAYLKVPPVISVGYRVCIRTGNMHWYQLPRYFLPTAAPNIKYVPLTDTHAKTLARFLFISTTSDPATLNPILSAAPTGDEMRLVSNDTSCDRTSLLPDNYFDRNLGLYCYASTGPYVSSTTTDVCSSINSIEYVNYGSDATSISATAGFITLPPFRSSYKAYKVCYRQVGYNWIEMEPGIVIQRERIIQTTMTEAHGGVYTTVPLVIPDGSHKFFFYDQIKFVRVGERCDYFAYEDILITVPSNGYTNSESKYFLTFPTTQNKTEYFTLCYRAASDPSQNWYVVTTTIVSYSSLISYVIDQPLIAGATVKITFLAEESILNSYPGKDSAKIVNISTPCSDANSMALGVEWDGKSDSERNAGTTDLGDMDTVDTKNTTLLVTLPSNANGYYEYRICYKSVSFKNLWTSVTPARVELRPTGSVVPSDKRFTVKPHGTMPIVYDSRLYSLEDTTAIISGVYSSSFIKILSTTIQSADINQLTSTDMFKFVMKKRSVSSSSCRSEVRYEDTGYTCRDTGEPAQNIYGASNNFWPEVNLPPIPGIYMACLQINSLTSQYILVDTNYIRVISNMITFAISNNQVYFQDTYTTGTPPVYASGLSGFDTVLIYPRTATCGTVRPTRSPSMLNSFGRRKVDDVTVPTYVLDDVPANQVPTKQAVIQSQSLIWDWPPQLADYKICIKKGSEQISNGAKNHIRVGYWYHVVEATTNSPYYRSPRVGGILDYVPYGLTTYGTTKKFTLGLQWPILFITEGKFAGSSTGSMWNTPIKYQLNLYDAPEEGFVADKQNATDVTLKPYDFIFHSRECPIATAEELFGVTNNAQQNLINGESQIYLDIRRNCPPSGCRLYASLGPLIYTFKTLSPVARSVQLSPRPTITNYHTKATLESPHYTGRNSLLDFVISTEDANGTKVTTTEGEVVMMFIRGHDTFISDVGCKFPATSQTCDGSPNLGLILRLGPNGRLTFQIEFFDRLVFIRNNRVETITFVFQYKYISLINGTNVTLTSERTVLVAIRPAYPTVLNIVDIYPVTVDGSPHLTVPKFDSEDFVKGMLSPYVVQNNIVAAPGYYMIANQPYTVVMEAVNDAGRPISAIGLNDESIVTTLSSTTPDNYLATLSRADVVFGTVNALNNGRVAVSFRVRRHCNISSPCKITFRTTITNAVGYITTPVRAKATKLAFFGAVKTNVIAGIAIPPITVMAVDDFGAVDEFNFADIQPMMSAGKHGVGLLDTAGNNGVRLRQQLNRGMATFSGLALNGLCVSECRIEFLSTWGGSMIRTPPLNTTTGVDRIRGSVYPDMISTQRLTVGNYFLVTITARTTDGDIAVSATDWIWVQLNQPLDNPPKYVVNGGRFKYLVRGVVVFNITMLGSCDACIFQFRAKPQDNHYTSDPAKGIWYTPSMTIAATVVPDRVALDFVSSNMQVVTDPNNSSVPWYAVNPQEYFEIGVAGTNIHGHVAVTSKDAVTVRTSNTGFVGLAELDGNGGQWTTFIPSHAIDGITLVNGKSSIRSMFPLPCLRCVLEFIVNGWQKMVIFITVKPKATIVSILSPYPLDSVTLRPYTSELYTDTAVWLYLWIAAKDANSYIDYINPYNLTISVQLPSSTVPQSLVCSTRYPCENRVFALRVATKVKSIVDMVTERLALGRNAEGGTVRIDVGGLADNIQGVLDISEVFGKLQKSIDPSKTISWTKSTGPQCIRVMDIAQFDPPLTGKIVSVRGHITPGVFGSVNYTQKGSIVVGVPAPFTVQAMDAKGNRVPNFNGTVNARFKYGLGCGAGLPDPVPATQMYFGNVTIWVTFRQPCYRCVMSFDVAPDPGPYDTLPITLRIVESLPFWVVPLKADTIAVSSDPLPSLVDINKPITVTLTRYFTAGGVLSQAIVGDSDARVGFISDIMNATDGIGTAATYGDNPGRYQYGNGGILWFGYSDIATIPTKRGVYNDMYIYRKDTVVQNFSFAFTRSCEACRVSIVIDYNGQVVRHVLKTTNGSLFTVRVGSDRTIIAGPPPDYLMRNIPFVITQWRANVYGEVDISNNATSPSKLQKDPLGGNGDGGVLVHSNDGQGIVESNWIRGTLMWRLMFTQACFLCTIRMDTDTLQIKVFTVADRLTIAQLSDTKVESNHSFIFTLYAVDGEGNRDYLLGAYPNGTTDTRYYDLNVKLSNSPFRYVPFDGQFGSCSVMQVYDNQLISGTATIRVTCWEPVRKAFILVTAYSGISSAANVTLNIPMPPTITVFTLPTKFRLVVTNASVSNNGTSVVAYLGNQFRVAALLSDDNGFVTGESSTQFKIALAGCSATFTSVGPVIAATDSGMATFDLTFNTLGSSTNTLSSSTSASFVSCRLVITSTTTLLPSSKSTQQLGVIIAVTNATQLVYVDAPSDFVAGKYRQISFKAVDDLGRISLTAKGTVRVTAGTGCGILVTDTNNVAITNGVAVIKAMLSGEGKCMLFANITDSNLMAPPPLNVTSRTPKFIRITQNITKLTDVLRTTTVYILPIEILDSYGNVVYGATDLSASTLTIYSKLSKGTDFQIRNMASTSMSDVGTTVKSVRGGYTFFIMFPFPTKSDTARVFITSPGLNTVFTNEMSIQVYASMVRLSSKTPLPTTWIVGRQFIVTIQASDANGNVPTGSDEYGSSVTITWSSVGTGASIGRFDSVAAPTLSTTLIRGEATIDLTYSGPGATVPIRIAGPDLTTYSANIQFQELVYLRLSTDSFSTSLSRSAVRLERITFNLNILDRQGNVAVGDSLSTVTIDTNKTNAKGDITSKTVSGGAASFTIYYETAVVNAVVSFYVDSPLLKARVFVQPFNITIPPTPAPVILAEYQAPPMKITISFFKKASDFNTTTFIAAVTSYVPAIFEDNVIVDKVCDSAVCLLNTSLMTRRRQKRTFQSQQTIAPGGVEVTFHLYFKKGTVIDVEATTLAAMDLVKQEFDTGPIRQFLGVQGKLAVGDPTSAPTTRPTPAPPPNATTFKTDPPDASSLRLMATTSLVFILLVAIFAI